ncbi:MAG: hypothetical protein WKG01_14905 [Kofleriaceae bacterium]
MAPEAFGGRVEPRSDLYGLGATAIRLATGALPFAGATLGEVIQDILTGRPRALAGMPRPLADLVARLVSRDVDLRPASAIAVLDELDALAPAIAPAAKRRARPIVGPPPAPAAWPGAAAFTARLAQALDDRTRAVLVVLGSEAAGTHVLVGAAVRRHQLEAVSRGSALHAAPGMLSGTLDEVAARLGHGLDPHASTRAWIERVARAARGEDRQIVVDALDDPRADDVILALARTPGARAVVVIVEGVRRAVDPERVAMLDVPILDVEAIARLAAGMLGHEPPPAWAAGLHATSQGLALSAIELVRSIADERDPFAVDWSTRSTAGAAEHRSRALRAIAPAPG